MKKSKGLQLGALLGAMLLVSMAAVGAEQPVGANLSSNTINLSNNTINLNNSTIPQEKKLDQNNTGIGEPTMPVFREVVIVYFKEMPASTNGFASKYGVKPIFIDSDIKMAAFETLPVGKTGRVSQRTLDVVSEFSNDSLVEKAFRDEYLFINTKTGYLLINAETGYYSTEPLIQGPEYYEKLRVEYIPNIVRVRFWRAPPSLEEFASKYGGKLMELSDADKFFMAAGFETSNISEFINKISTDPYVASVSLVGTEPSLASISVNNSSEVADTPKASGFESVVSILLLISIIFMMRRR
ncbi:hypothetical protein [Candidatus Methanoperedens nitratireducens]|uniref:Uncharacterized protein n=1 Tax=Candidatus Methanoperedens nitratireducens TaxID=1392998 RepID=A0A284VRK8_9EURY|nr:hypothetical protein [Candidatus Methanoperedens nitroreducens]SNQ61848.1 exported hypothetical protein [Candidatus Methanoperedens nitroreducens]